MSNVLINQGTMTAIKTDTVGTELYQIVKVDIGASGASSPWGGTVTVGTISQLTVGTVDTIGLLNANYFGTTVNSGTSTLGTIKASLGAGTRIYITDIVVSVGSASNVVIADGTVTSPVIGTLSLAANGGMVSNFRSPVRTSQGGTLVYQQSANGPLAITVNGYFAP